MGIAKYKEDDSEINDERMYYKDREAKRPKTYYPDGIDDFVEKLENIYEKNAKVKSVETTLSSQMANKNQNANLSVKENNKTEVIKPKEYADKTLYCKVCGKEFVFTKKDQIEYEKKGKCEPNRCAKCERRKSLPTWI